MHFLVYMHIPRRICISPRKRPLFVLFFYTVIGYTVRRGALICTASGLQAYISLVLAFLTVGLGTLVHQVTPMSNCLNNNLRLYSCLCLYQLWDLGNWMILLPSCHNRYYKQCREILTCDTTLGLTPDCRGLLVPRNLCQSRFKE